MRLKVCPFCGARAKFDRPGDAWHGEARMWRAGCVNGHATSPDLDTQKEAADWWNRRYIGPQYPKEKK